MKKTMHEFKAGTLHAGSKKGPVVTSRQQAIAIGLHEARMAGDPIPRTPRKKRPVGHKDGDLIRRALKRGGK